MVATVNIRGYDFPIRKLLGFYERSALRQAVGLNIWKLLCENGRATLFANDGEGFQEVAAFKNKEEVYLDYPERQATPIISLILEKSR